MSQPIAFTGIALRGAAARRIRVAVGVPAAAQREALCAGEVIKRLRGRGTVSTAELREAGISAAYASQLRHRGILERVAHGRSRLAPRFDHATS